MGRPRELTEVERSELLAKGFVPVEVWLPDLQSPAFRAMMERECASINAADQRSGELDRLSDLAEDLWDD